MVAYEWDKGKGSAMQACMTSLSNRRWVALEDSDLVYLPDRVVEDELRHQAIGSAEGVLLPMVAHTIRGK